MNPMRIIISSLLLVLLAACSDPLIMLPGGRLAGTETPTPEQWREVPNTIQLETNPDDPYSVNVWAAGIGADLYVATGEEGSTWSEYMEANPLVRVRMGDNIYLLSASRVSASQELAAVGAAYVAKYDMDPEDDWANAGRLYRLDRRQ